MSDHSQESARLRYQFEHARNETEKAEAARNYKRHTGMDIDPNYRPPLGSNFDEDWDEDDDEYDDDVQFGQDTNTPAQAQPPAETEAERLEREALADPNVAAQRQAAQTPEEQAAVPPETAPAQPGIRGDIAHPQGPDTEAQPPSGPGDQQQAQQGQDNRPKAGRKGAADQAKDKIKDKAKDELEKDVVKNTFREAVMAALKALVTNPYFWAVMVIIVVVIIVIALFAYFTGTAKSGANGMTPTQSATSLGNKTLLNKLSLLSGDTEKQKLLSQDFMKKAQKDILAIKDQAQNGVATLSPGTVAAADAILANITKYLQTPGTDLGNTIAGQIKIFLRDAQNDAVPVIPGPGFSPVNKDTISTFNTDLHFGTPVRPASVADKDGHGTYIANGQNSCDAVDIYTRDNTDVLPVFTGTIIDMHDDGSGMTYKDDAGKDQPTQRIVLRNGDYQILYAFVKPISGLRVGYVINDSNKTKPIGVTVQNVVHVEFTYCGICLITTALDEIDHDSATPTYQSWGNYLWVHIQEKLKLATN